jgi:DNA (cytosine-5)-methyltransferase 1
MVPRKQQFLVPDPKRAGQTWRRFVAHLRSLGYEVEWKVLCAADYGTPTTRSRLFMIARRDGQPIKWPEPTHFRNPEKGQKRWVAAHTCIDWSLPSRSIFEREKPLAPATLTRVARGLKKFVLDSGDPFIVPVTHTKSGARVHDIRDPLPTITTAKGGEFMVADPVLVAAFVEQANGGFNTSVAQDMRRPLTTVTTTGAQQRLVTAALVHLRGNCDARDLREPLRTISAGGEHHGVVEYHLAQHQEAGALRCAAFLMQYYSEGGQWSDLRNPLNTITTRDRLALVTVWIRGNPYVVVDICLRMLTPRELANASGFPPQYILSHGHDGRIFTKAQQVFHIGNAVPPLLQQAVTAAAYSDLPAPLVMRRVA